MSFYKTNFVALVLLLAPPSYSADFRTTCPLAFRKLVRYLTAPVARAQTRADVQRRLRAVLGSTYSEIDGLKIVNQTCLYKPGCAYDPIWNVIQMDSPGILKDDWAYGVVFGHELAHAIAASWNQRLIAARRGTPRERRKYLKTWSRIHRTLKSMNEYGPLGLWYFFTNAESRMYDLSEQASKQHSTYLQKYEGLIKAETPNVEKINWVATKFAKTSFGELFGDLASNAAHSDGDAIAKALERIDGKKHDDRMNSMDAKMPTGVKVSRVYLQDVHSTLTDVRRVIWNQYLKGKSDAEAQRVFDALNRAEEDWLEEALPLFTLGEKDPTSPRKPPEEELWQVDVHQLNHLFLKAFESHYVSQE